MATLDKKSSFIEVVISSVSILSAKFLSAPVELIKLRLQNVKSLIQSGVISQPYNGIVDVAKKVIKEQGFKSLWKGNLPNIFGALLDYQLRLYFMKQFSFDNNTNSKIFLSAQSLLLVTLSSSLTIICIYPLDYARTRLANDIINTNTKTKQFNGLIDVFRKTLSSDGVIGLYRGCLSSWFRLGLLFSIFNFTYPFFSKQNIIVQLGLASVGCRLIADLISYPLDTISQRMMMTSRKAQKYKGFIDCLQQIMKNQGKKSYFNGASVTIYSSFAVIIYYCSLKIIFGPPNKKQ